jgi:hypothetical protein
LIRGKIKVTQYCERKNFVKKLELHSKSTRTTTHYLQIRKTDPESKQKLETQSKSKSKKNLKPSRKKKKKKNLNPKPSRKKNIKKTPNLKLMIRTEKKKKIKATIMYEAGWVA